MPTKRQLLRRSTAAKVAGLDGAAFVAALKELEEMSRIASKLGGYASLNSSTHLTDAKASALYQRVG